jgi:uncharacterized protein (TIGR00730 family)
MRTKQEQEILQVTPARVDDAPPARKRKAAPKKGNRDRAPSTIPGLNNICVFCGSGTGKSPAYAAAAQLLGRTMAEAGIGLVYGGGSLGLMGEVARSVLTHGGYVTGIIPGFLTERERMLTDVNELIVTEDMHERKRLMFERSDAFVALPGGIGTLEELIEQLTWSQLGRHEKPIVVANIEGFWDPLKVLLEHMSAEAFIRQGLEVRFHVVDAAGAIVPAVADAIARAAPITVDSTVPDKF